jgi:hypothetical protein
MCAAACWRLEADPVDETLARMPEIPAPVQRVVRQCLEAEDIDAMSRENLQGAISEEGLVVVAFMSHEDWEEVTLAEGGIEDNDVEIRRTTAAFPARRWRQWLGMTVG